MSLTDFILKECNNPDGPNGIESKVEKLHDFIVSEAILVGSPEGTRCYLEKEVLYKFILDTSANKAEAIVLMEFSHLNIEALYVKAIITRALPILKTKTEFTEDDKSLIYASVRIIKRSGKPDYISEEDVTLFLKYEVPVAFSMGLMQSQGDA